MALFRGMIFLLVTISASAYAQEGGRYQFWNTKKVEQKKQSRWTLAEWMDQKQKIGLMNMWLARNSTSSPYEFFIEGGAFNYSAEQGTTKSNENLYRGAIGAYAGVVGIRGVYEDYSPGRDLWQGSLNVRLLGRSLQDTHINIEYGLQGVQTDSPKEKFQNQFAGVSTNLYITKYFGLSGSYQHIFADKSDLKNELRGERSDAGVFFDFGALRIFGKWRFEYLKTVSPAGTNIKQTNEGLGGGIQLFF